MQEPVVGRGIAAILTSRARAHLDRWALDSLARSARKNYWLAAAIQAAEHLDHQEQERRTAVVAEHRGMLLDVKLARARRILVGQRC
jgi:hypothetical protein